MNLTIPYDLPPPSRETWYLTETVMVRLKDGEAVRAYYSYILGRWLAEGTSRLIDPEDVMGWDDRGGDE